MDSDAWYKYSSRIVSTLKRLLKRSS